MTAATEKRADGLEELADWLKLRGDKRLVVKPGHFVVNDLHVAFAEFRAYQEQVVDAGHEAKNWRDHLAGKKPKFKPVTQIPCKICGGAGCGTCEGTGKVSPLFIGCFPEGFSYADRRREVDGDYKKIAFMSYRKLEPEIHAPKSDLIPLIMNHVRSMQKKRGDFFQATTTGRPVRLGEK